MNTYKITNLTNQLGRRDSKYNSVVDIEYIDNRAKKVAKVKPGETVFLSVQSLPLSVHRLRVKNVITVSEVSAAELRKSLEASKPKPAAKPKAKAPRKPKVSKKAIAVVADEASPKETITTKRTTKKKTTE